MAYAALHLQIEGSGCTALHYYQQLVCTGFRYVARLFTRALLGWAKPNLHVSILCGNSMSCHSWSLLLISSSSTASGDRCQWLAAAAACNGVHAPSASPGPNCAGSSVHRGSLELMGLGLICRLEGTGSTLKCCWDPGATCLHACSVLPGPS